MTRPRSDIEPRIVHAARERFLVDGVDGASLRAIAADAGTSIGMVYYYFPSKDTLFFGVVEETYDKLLKDLEQALLPDRPVRDRLVRLFERLASINDDESKMVRLLVREAMVSSERLERIFERFQRGHIPLVLRTVTDGLADGTFDPGLPPLAIGLATVMLAGPAQFVRRLAQARLPAAIVGDPAKGSELFIRVLLSGVGGRKQGEQ